MGRFTDSVKSLFGRRERRVFTPEDAAEIDDWVGEGGAAHPDGPPRVTDDADDTLPER
ncbi:hypothetical protein [Leucobacter chromiireducens]|uniref:hypothetical protein n=1 Tax=Leucobacter chromiireducens TaxID=283877 RepID=UPI00192713B5|nr:hypothetical protein [Leucobacter chromiireducens]